MSTSNGHGPHSWPVLALRVEPANVVPGAPAQVLLAVRNDSGVPAEVRFDVAGLNPEWVQIPEMTGPLAPGDTRQATLTVVLPAGYPPSELRAALHARALAPGTLVPLGRPVAADVVLHVAETGLIDATMPDEVYGAFHGRFHVSVRNRGHEPQVVELSGSSPVGRVKWSTRRVRLEPGGQAKVRAEVESKRAFTGPARRVPFAVKVKGRGAPVSIGGTFVQRPWLSTLWLKAGAIITTVLFFAALATIIVVKLTSTYAPNPTAVPVLKVPVTKPRPPKIPVTPPHRTTTDHGIPAPRVAAPPGPAPLGPGLRPRCRARAGKPGSRGRPPRPAQRTRHLGTRHLGTLAVTQGRLGPQPRKGGRKTGGNDNFLRPDDVRTDDVRTDDVQTNDVHHGPAHFDVVIRPGRGHKWTGHGGQPHRGECERAARVVGQHHEQRHCGGAPIPPTPAPWASSRATQVTPLVTPPARRGPAWLAGATQLVRRSPPRRSGAGSLPSRRSLPRQAITW